MCSVCTSDEHPDGPIVRSLHIEGARQASESDIKDRILSEETSKLPFTATHYFDPDVWKTDLRRIERFYTGAFRAESVKEENGAGPRVREDVVANGIRASGGYVPWVVVCVSPCAHSPKRACASI